MKNFLIRLLGGITPDEFRQLISAHESARGIYLQHIEYIEEQCKQGITRLNELQTIILKKTGMIPPEKGVPSVEQILHPITTRPKSWRAQREDLERKDREKLEEQWRKKDPDAKLMNEELKDAS